VLSSLTLYNLPTHITHGARYGSDVGNFLFDEKQSVFRGYVKTAANVTGRRRRSVAYTESTDLLTWPPQPLLILTPDDLDDFGNWTTNFYGMPVIQCVGVVRAVFLQPAAGQCLARCG
jgi:hypothetical protein